MRTEILEGLMWFAGGLITMLTINDKLIKSPIGKLSEELTKQISELTNSIKETNKSFISLDKEHSIHKAAIEKDVKNLQKDVDDLDHRVSNVEEKISRAS